MIHGSCSDYRAAATVDLEHDTADIARKVECPALVFYGSRGQMAKLFDIPAEWRKRLAKITEASLPGGHFFVDQFPRETAEILLDFLAGRRVDSKEAFYRAKDLLMKKARKVPVAFASEAEERAYWEREDSTADLDWRRAKRVRLPNL
jgi:hypothetical protein